MIKCRWFKSIACVTFHTVLFELTAMIIFMTTFTIRCDRFEPNRFTRPCRKLTFFANMTFCARNDLVFALQWKLSCIMIDSNAFRGMALFTLLWSKLT